MRIILFNGPPFCGKDTAVSALDTFNYTHLKFAQPIDDAITGFLGRDTDLGNLYLDVVQDPTRKDSKLFNGHSCRDLKIAFSETYAKAYFGRSIFGQLCALRCIAERKSETDEFVISDCGFQKEFDSFCETIKAHDYWNEIILVRVSRIGCDFSNDSREYVNPNGLTDMYLQLNNTGSLAEYQASVKELIYGT